MTADRSAKTASNSFWSPFGPLIHRRASSKGSDSSRKPGCEERRGPEVDQQKPVARHGKALMKTTSHQGFSVGLTGFEPATP